MAIGAETGGLVADEAGQFRGGPVSLKKSSNQKVGVFSLSEAILIGIDKEIRKGIPC
jgi:hypothetical protein